MSDRNEHVSRLPLDRIRESPFNPRLTYDEDALAELADSIKQVQVLQPIVVRPVTGEHDFEVVFGHRRYRASALASAVDVPAIVRAMTDEEAALAQIHENLKRADVHPLEEALGYQRLMHDHGVTVGELIERTGKSKSYIYARLKLVTLGEDARAAFLKGELDAETAVLLARYCRGNAQQAKALKLITMDDPDHPGRRKPVSHRNAKDVLRVTFCIRISEAPFDTGDPKLMKDTPACSACPKLAGNDPELADAKVDADICTDPACHTAKSQAHADAAVARARKRGLQVLEGDDAKRLLPHHWMHKPDAHQLLTSVAFTERGADGVVRPVQLRQALEDMGRNAPKPVLIMHPHKPGAVVEALADAEVAKVLKHGRADAQVAERLAWMLGDEDGDDSTDTGSASPMSHRRPVDDRPPEELAVIDHWHTVKLAIMARVLETPRTTDDMRLILQREIQLAGELGHATEELLGWKAAAAQDADAFEDDPTSWRMARLVAMTADQLAAAIVMTTIDDWQAPHKDRVIQRTALARAYGIDPLQVAGLQTAAAATSDTGALFADATEPT